MKLNDYLNQHGIKKITVNKTKTGRLVSDVATRDGITRLFFATDCDTKKPLFVNKGAHDALWVGNNSGMQEVGEVVVQ